MKGSLIKQHRKFKNMTLEDLASGICSVSYLSKIEHNTINASEEIYRLLGERLNIKLMDINQDFDQQIYQDLLDWHEAIQLRDLPLMDEYYNKCKGYLEKNHNFDLTNLFSIIQARHTMKVTESPLPNNILKEIEDIHPYANDEFKFFYHKTLGIQCLLNKHQLKEALHHFLKAADLLNKLPFEDSEAYFHLALTYSQTRSAVESNYYAHIALEEYIKDFDYERIVDTYMIIALNYRALNIYPVAEKYFKKLLKISKYHLKSIEKRRIYHNLGYIYANQERYEDAFQFLNKAYTIKTEEVFFNISTIYLLASTHYYGGNLDECWDYIYKGEKEAEEHDILFFKHKFFVLKHTILDTTHDKEFIEKLENEIIPNSRKNNEYGEYKNYLEMLGNIYFSKRMYKKAAIYYNESNNYKDTQKKDLL